MSDTEDSNSVDARLKFVIVGDGAAGKVCTLYPVLLDLLSYRLEYHIKVMFLCPKYMLIIADKN